MKPFILKAGLLTCFLLLGGTYEKVAAATTWPTKCSLLEEIKPNQNPSPQVINCLLTNAALQANIPPEVVKAVAAQESDWRQFDPNGEPFKSPDGGFGIMQVTNLTKDGQTKYDSEKLKNDIYYNIQTGVEILKNMYIRTDLPKINGAGSDVIENWYFPVMAYNGTKPVNSPIHQSDGSRNTDAYQDKVFAYIEKDSFLNDTPLAQFPFSTGDFVYQTDSDENIGFNKMVYTLTDQMHASRYFFHNEDKVVVTEDNVKLRSENSSGSSIVKYLGKGTTLIIGGDFTYDQSLSSLNRFVWYPVKFKTTDTKPAGYISSAYISKKLDAPQVNPVDDNDLSLSGKAPANVMVQIMNGTLRIGSPKAADAAGSFTITIPAQKAGTKLTVTYKDNLNELSPSTTITVIDKTAPLAPTVNTVTNKSAGITGKTEANATVMVVIGGKTYSAKADRYGNYKVSIPVQNTGISLSVRAKDSAGNVGAIRKVTVVRVAPNMPTVNTVKYYSTTVTGKAEKYATVAVKIGSKTYTAKVNAYGNFKVSIPKQRVGTKIYVSAKDTKGKVSATRSVTVSK